MLIGGKRYNIHQQHIINNVITMTDATNSTIEFFIVATLFVLDAVYTLLSGIKVGIFKTQRAWPIKKSTTQLNKMLKKDLVDLVVAYQQ